MLLFKAKLGFSLLEFMMVLGITGAFGASLLLSRSSTPQLPTVSTDCQAVSHASRRLLQQRQWYLVATQEQPYVPCKLS